MTKLSLMLNPKYVIGLRLLAPVIDKVYMVECSAMFQYCLLRNIHVHLH